MTAPVQRTTVNLSERTVAALDTLAGPGVTRTDAINKGVQVYAYLQRLFAEGGTVWVQDKPGAAMERLRLL